MITTNTAAGCFALLIDAPALSVGILVVEPETVTATFLFLLFHTIT